MFATISIFTLFLIFMMWLFVMLIVAWMAVYGSFFALRYFFKSIKGLIEMV